MKIDDERESKLGNEAWKGSQIINLRIVCVELCSVICDKRSSSSEKIKVINDLFIKVNSLLLKRWRETLKTKSMNMFP